MSQINREALMKELGIGMDCSVCEHNETPFCIWKPNVVDICEAITNAPTIEPEPQAGKWRAFYECPYCGEISTEPSAKCPCCQKDMA